MGDGSYIHPGGRGSRMRGGGEGGFHQRMKIKRVTG
jgi:hypothetical protein